MLPLLTNISPNEQNFANINQYQSKWVKIWQTEPLAVLIWALWNVVAIHFCARRCKMWSQFTRSNFAERRRVIMTIQWWGHDQQSRKTGRFDLWFCLQKSKLGTNWCVGKMSHLPQFKRKANAMLELDVCRQFIHSHPLSDWWKFSSNHRSTFLIIICLWYYKVFGIPTRYISVLV